MVSFFAELDVTRGSVADWAYFARWHYRSHRVGSVRFVTVLWHGERPIGICVFTAAALSLAARNRFFGRRGRWTSLTLRSLNRQLVCLARVVVEPTYRGAGIASAFVRRSCELCPYPWIEALAQMGRVNPFFERAGFARVESPARKRDDRAGHSAMYGTPGGPVGGRRTKRLVTAEMHHKSRFADPVYYVFDNRAHVRPPIGTRRVDDQDRYAGCESDEDGCSSRVQRLRDVRRGEPLTPDPFSQGRGGLERNPPVKRGGESERQSP